MNKCFIIIALMLMTTASVLTACSPDDDPVLETPETPIPKPEEPGGNDNNSGNDNENSGNENDNENNNGGENEMSRNITISVGNHSFDATLEDNATASAYAALLPMTISMNELNGNEKYHYLSKNLPTDSYRPETIRNGDLMLYGSNCLVLFYETFSSSYSYTRIGKINNPSGLASALGQGNATVTFEIKNN
ncbi:cyclophilin-like fold protein [Bacteroides finegoldii]|uniref:cyclophilin-like fold protein n=1 Tax=Bacteroides finegoldii TaxID=338188 RepID=UPI001E4E4C40|nr:cyclophilin-like fold protein [Bacteroides finegoldii]